MKTPILHDSFSMERRLRADPARAFRAWATKEEKEKWFIGPKDRWREVTRVMDFRVDGTELVVGEFDGHGSSKFDARYLEIVESERIVYAYRMYVSDVLLSTTLVTVTFEAEGGGTLMKFTEQGVYYADRSATESRFTGTEMLMDQFVKWVDG